MIRRENTSAQQRNGYLVVRIFKARLCVVMTAFKIAWCFKPEILCWHGREQGWWKAQDCMLLILLSERSKHSCAVLLHVDVMLSSWRRGARERRGPVVDNGAILTELSSCSGSFSQIATFLW